MREILFRGKRTYNGEWVEGSLICYADGWTFICVQGENMDVLDKFRVIPDTVGQYTGLTANGKKIFEGDIVSTDIARPYLIVEYRDGCFMFNCNAGGEDYYAIMLPICKEPHTKYEYGEVIGNIHDNPELVKGAKDDA